MIALTRLDPTGTDREALVQFIVKNQWPFHVLVRRTTDQVRESIDQGAFRDDACDTYWVEHDELGRIGIMRFEDLDDPTPLFDLRLAEEFRGRGLGVEVLRAATDHVFTAMEHVHRFEGHTRADNLPMRMTFERAGWVQEAHYRQGWPTGDGRHLDSVAYAVLRSDWENCTRTPAHLGCLAP